jgi:hypothetical protein
VVCRAGALGGDDVGVVAERDFVDDADKALLPAVFVIVGVLGAGRRIGYPQRGVGEARL